MPSFERSLSNLKRKSNSDLSWDKKNDANSFQQTSATVTLDLKLTALHGMESLYEEVGL